MTVIIFGLIMLSSLACGQTSLIQNNNQQAAQIQKDNCDDPDADISCCFINMPEVLTGTMTIANENEPGEKLIITGRILRADGKTPYPDVILYAYHTDNNGYYSKKGDEKGIRKWHGRLHGWCRTDSSGYYKIQTIRPARYPNNTMPAHIHAAIKTDEGKMYWISDFVFSDDNLVNEKRLLSRSNTGGTGIVDVKKNSRNMWTGERDIVINR